MSVFVRLHECFRSYVLSVFVRVVGASCQPACSPCVRSCVGVGVGGCVFLTLVLIFLGGSSPKDMWCTMWDRFVIAFRRIQKNPKIKKCLRHRERGKRTNDVNTTGQTKRRGRLAEEGE